VNEANYLNFIQSNKVTMTKPNFVEI